MKVYTWGHNRRFNSYADYFRKHFGNRVQKLTVDAGFTCPNRDGSKGQGGCTYCNNNAFSPNYCKPSKSITQQLDEGIRFHQMRYRRVSKYIAYFQAYSNTYGSTDRLRKLYHEALGHPGVIGLIVGTRPDCVNLELLDWFSHLAREYFIMIEYGIESCHESTLLRINRGHTFEDSVKAIELTAEKGIRQGVHMITGLPGEGKKEIFECVRKISEMPVNNIKFHHLQIVRETQMAKEFEENPAAFRLFTLPEYLDLMVGIIERLNPAIVVERIAGEAHPDYLLQPIWGLRYDEVLRKFEAILEKRGTHQGKLWEEKNE